MSVKGDSALPVADASFVAIDPGEVPRRRTGIGTHYLRYSTANVVVLLAGLVSFPVLTRLLDNTQYGVMGYFNTLLLVAIAIAKLGGQHSIIRFYPHDGDARQLTHFSTNLVFLPMLFSLSLWALVAATLLGLQWWGAAHFDPVFWCVVLLVPVMVVASIVQAVVRASERSGLVMVTKVVGRLLELALVLGLVVWVQRTAFAVYGGRLIAGIVLLGYFVYWAHRHLKFSRAAIDFPAMGAALFYGLPLMANEFAGSLLDAVDRVLLKQITNDFAVVGIYSIGYSLATQVNLFMNATMWEAFVPVANRVYGGEGDAAVRALKDRVLLPLTYASFAVAGMLLAVGTDLLVALSGTGKAASGAVFVVVGTFMALYPLLDIAGYGLLLRKRSMLVFVLTLAAAALNVVANLLLIPRFGYMGAAWATVLSLAALAIANCFFCPPGLRRFPDLRALAIACGFALLLIAVVRGSDVFGIQSHWLRVFVACGLFLPLYALPVWLLDPRLRAAMPKFRRANR